jgi:ATP-binding cassette subfamily C protein LapB
MLQAWHNSSSAGPSAKARKRTDAAPERASIFAKAAKEFSTTPPSVLLASFLVNLLALGLPLTLMQIYDRVLPNAAINTMVGLLLGLAGVVVVDVALRILRDTLITQTAVEQAFRQRVLGVARLIYADPASLKGKPGRYWLDRMMAVEDVASVNEKADKSLFIDLPFVVIFLGMTALIGGWLAAIPLVLIGVFVLVMRAMTSRQRSWAEERRQEDEKRYSQIAEWLGGIGTIKCLAMENQIDRRYEAMLARGVAYSYYAVLQNNRLPMLGQLFSNLMMVAVSTGGAVLVIQGAMSIGSLACCSMLATRVAQPVFRVMSIAAHMRAFALVEARANAVHGLPATPAPPMNAARPRGSLRLREVCVAPRPGWGGFKSLDLVVEAGEIVGITGPMGCGKSAVLSLVDGTLRPDSGYVLIGGEDAASPDTPPLGRALQRIDGRVTIFRGTILENVAMFRTGAFIAEAVAAVEVIGLESQINKLPEGYDTQIGDGAATVLPYGFQQSLMIARALAQQPVFLLVSQIGALLDIDNFRRLERALRHMPSPPTTLLASERGSVLTAASRVYEIRDGALYRLGDIGAPAQGRREMAGPPAIPLPQQG